MNLKETTIGVMLTNYVSIRVEKNLFFKKKNNPLVFLDLLKRNKILLFF